MLFQVVFLLLSQSHYSPQEVEDIFNQANAAYARGKLGDALELYEKLIQKGHANSDVFFNAGTAYLANGQLGPAVVLLERARRREGKTKDLEAQLNIAEARKKDRLAEVASFEKLLETLAMSTPPVWSFLVFVVSFCSFLWMTWLHGLWRKWLRGQWVLLAALLLGLSVLTGAIGASQLWWMTLMKEAVISATAVSVHSYPLPDANVSLEIHEGLKVRVLEEEGAFTKIRLPNGVQGWILSKELTVI